MDAMKTLTVSATEKGFLVFVVCSLLLNGVALYKSAQLTEHGALQEKLTALALPLKKISQEMGFYQVRNAVAETVGLWLNQKESEK